MTDHHAGLRSINPTAECGRGSEPPSRPVPESLSVWATA